MSVTGTRRNEANYGHLANAGSVTAMSVAAKSTKNPPLILCQISLQTEISRRLALKTSDITLPMIQLRPLQPTKQP